MTKTSPLLILTYHAIDHRPDVISVSPEQFSWQMEQLAARGLNGISLNMAFEHSEKTGQYPPDSVVLTFDDGYLSVLKHALPVLQQFGFRATVFLVAGMMGRDAAQARAAHPDFNRDLLDWDQAGILVRSGFEVGSHTLTHPDLRQLSQAALEQELAGSKNLLEQNLQTRVDALAYPYGHFNAEVISFASRFYRHACTTRLGRCNMPPDLTRLNRVDAWYLKRPQRFLKLVDGGLEGWLHFRQHLRDLKNLAGRAVTGKNPHPSTASRIAEK